MLGSLVFITSPDLPPSPLLGVSSWMSPLSTSLKLPSSPAAPTLLRLLCFHSQGSLRWKTVFLQLKEWLWTVVLLAPRSVPGAGAVQQSCVPRFNWSGPKEGGLCCHKGYCKTQPRETTGHLGVTFSLKMLLFASQSGLLEPKGDISLRFSWVELAVSVLSRQPALVWSHEPSVILPLTAESRRYDMCGMLTPR